MILLAIAAMKSQSVNRRINIEQEIQQVNAAEVITISHPSGYYEMPFELKMAAPPNMDIFYTLDCSIPTRNSIKYEKPIKIEDASVHDNVFINQIEGFDNKGYKSDKATIVRAALFDGKKKIGTDMVLTYFVNMENKDIYAKLPVISIVMNEADLFDADTGIYVTGTLYKDYPDKLVKTLKPANYALKGKEVERSCYIDYFKEKFEPAFSGKLGIRLRGGGSRTYAQKAFNLYARAEKGETPIKNVFTDYEQGIHSLAVVTDYGDDTKIKIPLGVELSGEFSFETLQCFPCNVFLNGEYWGIYYLSERYTADYFEHYFGIDESNLIMIKKNLSGTEVEIGNEADIRIYEELLDFIRTHDMSSDENFRELEEQVDIDSLLDYYCFECCINNRDWPWNNYALWRSRESGEGEYNDGRWRFLLFDTNDGSCWGAVGADKNIYERLRDDELIMHLLQNEQFRKRFITRLCDIFSITMEQEVVQKVTDDYVSIMEESYVQDAKLFHKDYKSFDMEQHIADEIEEFLYLKEDILLQQTKEALQIEEGVVEFALVVPDAGADCIVKINGLSVDLSYGSWMGKYYAGCPIELEMITDSDSDFSGWELSTEEDLIEQKKISFTIPKEGIVIRAVK